MDVSDLRLLRTKVMVAPLEIPEYQDGALVVPGTVGETIPPQQGTVVNVGPEVSKTSCGRRVVFGLGVGTVTWTCGAFYLFLDEKDIVCGIS